MSAATLFEHDDGRYAVAPGTESPAFTRNDPAWHRVGPVDVSALATPDADLLAALILMVRTHDEPADSLLDEVKEQQWLAQARAAIAKATGGAS